MLAAMWVKDYNNWCFQACCLECSCLVAACRSPEAVNPGDCALTTAADIWSLAATMLHIFTGKAPYEGLTVIQIVAKLACLQMRPTVPSTPCMPVALQALLCKCFDFQPAHRPSIQQLVEYLQVAQRPRLTIRCAFLSLCVRLADAVVIVVLVLVLAVAVVRLLLMRYVWQCCCEFK